jgi:hypothetical protein
MDVPVLRHGGATGKAVWETAETNL